MTRQEIDDPDPADTLVRRFDRQAGRTPRATAVRSGTDVLTYGDLARGSRDLADRLAPFTAARGGPGAVLLGPRPAQGCAALAAMRCGRPYPPVAPASPRRRVDLVLADAAPAAVVAAGPRGTPTITA